MSYVPHNGAGVELTQVILRHAELDKSSSTGAEAGTQSRTGVKQQRNASGIKQRALSQVAPSTSVYQRLYQVCWLYIAPQAVSAVRI